MEHKEPGRIRKLGVVLFILALLATMLGAFHLIENWRGKKKWEAYKRKLIAQGAKLDLVDFVPPMIPEKQNFAATPFFDDMLPGPKPTNWNSKHWPETFSRLHPQTTSGKRERSLTDFMAWQRAIHRGTNQPGPEDRAKAAEEVLGVLKEYDPALQELRAASERPRARYNIHYNMQNPWGIFLPHLVVIKELTQLLNVKACAELATGNSEAALNDIRLMIRVIDSMESEMFLITYIVRIACLQIAMQPIWEGLALDRWSDAQLEELQRLMLRFNFVDDLTIPMASERAAGVLTADLLIRERELLQALVNPDSPRPSGLGLNTAVLLLVPRGWYRLEQYEYVDLFQRFVMAGFDGTNRVIYPAVVNANEAALDKAFHTGHPILSHRFLSALLMPAVAKTQMRAAHGQTGAHLVAIACALERYRHKHGEYPNELPALAPEFMASVPHDVINGNPMRYKPGKPFVLYSVGWDEKDNGGAPGKGQWGDTGDWVWTYPGNSR